MTRFNDAIAIQNGACNPSGICNAIIRAQQEIFKEGKGTDDVRSDPAVRLMVHQLAFLCCASEVDNNFSLYRQLTTYCEERQ